MKAEKYLGEGFVASYDGHAFYLFRGDYPVMLIELRDKPHIIDGFRDFVDHVRILTQFPSGGRA